MTSNEGMHSHLILDEYTCEELESVAIILRSDFLGVQVPTFDADKEKLQGCADKLSVEIMCSRL
jgi:hypothetical protein